jgi:hypothetical protein
MYLRSRWLPLLMSLCAVVPCARSESLPESVRACAQESDAGRRLACYDKEVARLNQPPGQGKDSQTEDRFGAEGKLQANGAVAKLDKLEAHIGAISHRPDGKLVLRLVNDQIWEQTEYGPDLRLQEGDLVQIRRGVLGAYWLSAHSRGRGTIKVQRTH